MKTLEELLENTTETEKGCLEWKSRCDEYGYGRVWFNGKSAQKVTRVVMQLLGHDIDGLLVLHTCDNPPCINPEHLFLGTNLDNAHDAMKKGRRPGIPTKHGYRGTYQHGCRCSLCKTANTEYIKGRNQALKIAKALGRVST